MKVKSTSLVLAAAGFILAGSMSPAFANNDMVDCKGADGKMTKEKSAKECTDKKGTVVEKKM